MKCPKCGYLGFEDVQRCRNCGYDFSLSTPTDISDFPMRARRAETLEPLADLTLVDAASVATLRAAAAPNTNAGVTAELPLFTLPGGDDVALITKASPPRTPLAVRRATPEVPRLRPELRSPMLDLRADLEPSSSALVAREGDRSHAVEAPEGFPADETASPAARLLATAVDVVLLAAIDAAVIYFTLQICGLGLDEFSLVPKVPLVAFLTLQNVAYFIAFTAEGHTLGQMAAGIKVVAGEAHASPDLRHAVVRTFVWLALAVPAGVGLLTVLFSRDHRGFHDRCAGTRVVRASA